MRLINTSTLGLEEFVGVQVPVYAILSHTWEDSELTLRDFADLKLASQKKGFAKVEHSCRLARQTGINYAWVDTCCIDKTSSAELSEAINSMFRWYASAAVCYAYLADLNAEDPVDAEPTSQFARCRWFTRGWTLQELIAPTTVEFYDRDWTFRGTKATLGQAISTLTHIDHEVLRDSSVLFSLPIARRLCWAAHRRTTRVEDVAYSLMGICNVNMPMLYGEGDKAFIRLQEEIIKETDDLTLFAWQAVVTDQTRSDPHGSPEHSPRGILATSPAEFAHAHDLMRVSNPKLNPEIALTNKGLRIRDPRGYLGEGQRGGTILSLGCYRQGVPDQKLGIQLWNLGGWTYARRGPEKLVVTDWRSPIGHDGNIYIWKVTRR